MTKPNRSKPHPRARKREQPSPQPDALAYRINEVRRMGGPGRTKSYELIKLGKLKKVTVGGCTLIEGDSLRALLRDGCE